MTSADIGKALEVWTLQNLLDLSILLAILAMVLTVIQGYYSSLERRLSLRVSIEIWNVFTILMVDILLTVAVLVGYLVLNPDIMADIKMAVPFCPVASVLLAVALVLRLFYGGHDPSSPNFLRSVWLMAAANVINIVGFTFVMEAPGSEYLEIHPSAFWTYVRTHLRSNAAPHGLELAQITFYVCFPILMIVLVWGIASGLKRIQSGKPVQSGEDE